MKKFKFLVVSVIVAMFFSTATNAQIGMAVAKDENGSSVRWQVSYGGDSKTVWDAETKAKKELQAMGYNKIVTLTCSDECGHRVTGGYWVVVEAKRTNYNNISITSFGMGASASSYNEAEERAVANLKKYDWSWTKDNGYTIVKQATF